MVCTQSKENVYTRYTSSETTFNDILFDSSSQYIEVSGGDSTTISLLISYYPLRPDSQRNITQLYVFKQEENTIRDCFEKDYSQAIETINLTNSTQ